MSKKAKEIIEPVEQVEQAVEPLEPEKPEAVCYIGPTIPDKVMHGTIYKDGMPEIAGSVAFKSLFVPVSQIPNLNKDFVAALSNAVRKEA